MKINKCIYRFTLYFLCITCKLFISLGFNTLGVYADNNLQKLPSDIEIKNRNSIGKSDPFSSLELNDDNKFISINLLGILETDLKKVAIVNYLNNIGHLEVGQIGGETTKLLPRNVSLKEIIIEKQMIIINFKNKDYIVKIK